MYVLGEGILNKGILLYSPEGIHAINRGPLYSVISRQLQYAMFILYLGIWLRMHVCYYCVYFVQYPHKEANQVDECILARGLIPIYIDLF